jgi:hypothetical protein
MSDEFPAWIDRAAIEASLAQHKSPADMMGGRIRGIIDGTISPVPTPWRHFDDIKAAMPGTINVLCGDPGSAKSFAILQAVAYAHRLGISVGLLELECSREWHLHRYLAQISEEPGVTSIDWIKTNGERMNTLMDLHRQRLNSLGNVLDVTDGKLLTVRDIMKWTTDRLESGVKLIAIDPITAMETSAKPWADDQELITGMRRLLERHHAAAWLVTHPKKGRKNEISLEVLAGGAAISRFSDVVLWLERLDKPQRHWLKNGITPQPGQRVLHVMKCRDGTAAGRKLSVSLNHKNLTFDTHGWIERIEYVDATSQAVEDSSF